MSLAPGEVVDGRYRVERVLHDGPRSLVVAATRVDSGARMAIQMLRASHDPAAVARFMQAARIATSIGGPRVVAMFDIGRTPQREPFMVMELVDGPNLDAYLAAHAPLAPGVAVGLLIQICEAVAAIHAARVVHRDLQPSNLLVGRRDGAPFIQVTDFKLARSLDMQRPTPWRGGAMVLGTPPYASPEQLVSPEVDERSDLWSIGVLACALLGHAPFGAPSFAELVATIHEGTPATLPPTAPPALAAVIARCLAHDPAARFATAGEVITALHAE